MRKASLSSSHRGMRSKCWQKGCLIQPRGADVDQLLHQTVQERLTLTNFTPSSASVDLKQPTSRYSRPDVSSIYPLLASTP